MGKIDYRLKEVHEVRGRQGIAVLKNGFIVSGSTTLTRYDAQWNVCCENAAPFAVGFSQEVNHIGDIDVFDGEVFCGAELFLDGVASNIQIAVFDAQTLQFKRAFPFAPESGQTECSGITVNPDDRTLWMSSWANGDSGRARICARCTCTRCRSGSRAWHITTAHFISLPTTGTPMMTSRITFTAPRSPRVRRTAG